MVACWLYQIETTGGGGSMLYSFEDMNNIAIVGLLDEFAMEFLAIYVSIG
jgi:hypothetical protein